jgi:carbon-monoxide dehydrogenase medium subunit
MRSFTILEPTSPEEVCSLLANYDNTAVYAGGTELLFAMKQGLVHFERLIDLKGITNFGGVDIDVDQRTVRVGATVTHTRLAREVRQALPLLSDIESKIGNIRVRNVGTIGGNLGFAEPASDVGVIGILLGGRVSLVRPGVRRIVDLANFFVDAYETILERDEIIEHIEVDIPSPSVGLGYERFKLKERPLVAAGVAMCIDGQRRVIESARVVVGAVSPIPRVLEVASGSLQGVPLIELPKAAEGLARLAAKEVNTIGDFEVTERFRRHITGVVVKRACLNAAENWAQGRMSES